ncbi:MAG: hypothetical protein R6V83_00580 [Candidatus Thorarchaeota archaeon]
MDYEMLDNARKIGILGSLLGIFAGYPIVLALVYGKTFEYVGLGMDYWALGGISLNGYYALLALLPLVTGLLASIPLYRKIIRKLFLLLTALLCLAVTVLTIVWVISYGGAFQETARSQSLQLSLEEFGTMELLWNLRCFLTILFLFLAGLAGVVGRESDRITLAGYIITLIGGLASLAIAVAGSTALLPGLGGVDWIPLASTISLISYVGLMPVFYRPITQPRPAQDTRTGVS